MNEPVMVIQTALFTHEYNYRVVHVLIAFLQSTVHICSVKLVYICGHFLTVNNRCYGRCYIKNIIPLCTFLEFYTHLQANSARSFKNAFTSVHWLQILCFLKSCIFDECCHFSSYRATLSLHNLKNVCHISDPKSIKTLFFKHNGRRIKNNEWLHTKEMKRRQLLFNGLKSLAKLFQIRCL